MTDWYVASGSPATSAAGASAPIRSEFSAIQTAMALLPGYTGNGLKSVRVNTGGTALEAVAVTGTGNAVFSASPTLTGTVTAAAAALSGALVSDATTDSTSTITGAVQTDGGLGVAKALWVGGLANIAGAVTLQSTLAVVGTTTIAAGSAASPSVTPTGDPNTGIWAPAADTLAVSTAGVECVRVGSGGAVTLNGAISGGIAMQLVKSATTAKTSFAVNAQDDENYSTGAACAVVMGRNTGTGRSLNAGGTLNASGADYAEYEHNNGLRIAKGAIVGFKADGTLTLVFSEAVRFGVKSTDPSFVGGDAWGNETALGKKPKDNDDAGLKGFAAAAEAARQTVDRIAYAGKVPVNVTEAKPGDYIVAVADASGAIIGKPIASPTFDQYRAAVGRVNRILPDGRAEIAVMVH